MGKRLFRIFAKDIPSRISSLLGTEINIILTDKKTIHGLLLSIGSDILEVQDFLHHKHQVQLSDISEIIYDKESAY